MPFEGNETKQEETTPEVAQTAESVANQPGYITTEQLQQALNATKSELQQKMDNWYHGIQTVDSRVQQRIKSWEDAAKAKGVQLSDSQRKLLQDTALIQTIAEEGNSVTQPTATPGQEKQVGNVEQQLAERVNAAAQTMQVAAGITFEENDPEIAIMEAAENGTPKEYLDAVRKAIDAKELRLKSPVAPRNPGMVKGVPQTNPIQDIKDPRELYRRGFAKS